MYVSYNNHSKEKHHGQYRFMPHPTAVSFMDRLSRSGSDNLRPNRIAVVSDELDADPFMKNIYLMAAPPNIKVDCFGNQSFAAAWKENQLGDGNVLVLFPSLAAVQDAIQLGFDVTRIQVGGLGGGQTARRFFKNITLDEKDVGILNDLKNRGVQVFFQTIPEDKPQPLDDILKKF
ncbi:PTS system sorbose subfamily IIB component [Salmonella enterica subsp. enterica]|nr:PTS system sorbose subfamily IIB component [Salmonella enterica subsp. enterica]